MKQQNFSNHSRLLVGFHGITFFLIFGIFVLSVINFFKVLGEPSWVYTGLMPMLSGIVLCLMFFYIRQFPLKAQDRAIRAEENFRYFVITGKRFDERLTMAQIIALRFAPDDELAALAARAVKENLSSKEIKKAITNWLPDNHRV